MSQNDNSTSPILPTARKSRRTSQRNRPVLVSSRSLGTQESQESQVEMLEPEIKAGAVSTETHAEVATTTETPEVPAKARRVPRLPGFFSRVEKTVEEPETSQEAVVKARLARAKKTPLKAEVTSEASEQKERDKKPASGNRTAASNRPEPLFKTRHLIGMGAYLIGAEFILPLERSLCLQYKIEQTLTQFNLFNFPIIITTSVLFNIATLIIFLVVLVKLDLLPTSLAGRSAAAARAQQQKRAQGTPAEKQPQLTMRQGVKGEDDDLYQAYRSNQKREKKH